MIPGVGWSASDLVLAIKVIHKVGLAFRSAGGATEQYASTVAFLDAFARTLDRINLYQDSADVPEEDAEFSKDLAVQMNFMHSEYDKFDHYLQKVEPNLSSKNIFRQFAGRTKWAIKEINEKVDGLKKAVISPMMFITPLLTVEVLKEIKELRAHLPAASAALEGALRENRDLIVQTNSDLSKLRANLNYHTAPLRSAMTAVEQDVHCLNAVVESNSELIKASEASIRESIQEESSKLRQEQAAANVAAMSSLENVMADRLSTVEKQIDTLITETKQRTGTKDKELHDIKARVKTSRKHLKSAASSGRKVLKQFTRLVSSMNAVQSSRFAANLLHLAQVCAVLEKIVDSAVGLASEGRNMVVEGGQFVKKSGVMKNLSDGVVKTNGLVKNWSDDAIQRAKDRRFRTPTTPLSPVLTDLTVEDSPSTQSATQEIVDEGYDSEGRASLNDTSSAKSPVGDRALPPKPPPKPLRLSSPRQSSTGAEWTRLSSSQQAHDAEEILNVRNNLIKSRQHKTVS